MQVTCMNAMYHTSSGTTRPNKYCTLTTYISEFSSVFLWAGVLLLSLSVLHHIGLA